MAAATVIAAGMTRTVVVMRAHEAITRNQFPLQVRHAAGIDIEIATVIDRGGGRRAAAVDIHHIVGIERDIRHGRVFEGHIVGFSHVSGPFRFGSICYVALNSELGD